jgi:hypothetical protein
MAAQPFDKATADKLVEAFNNLNAEIKDTLSNLDKIVDTEKRMVDIAKQLGQAYKTQKDKLDEQLKGKSLQEKLSSKFVNSEKKLNEFAQARINSYIKIESLQNELLTNAAELLVEQSKDPTSDTVIALQDLINKKSTELNLEEHLLKNSASKLESLKLHNFLLKAANELIDLYNKALEMGVKLLNKMGDLASGLATKLNIPTTLAGTFERILDVFNQIDTAATNVRQKFGLLPSQGAIFEKNIREASIELAEFGINAEQLGGTMKQIGSTFTSLQSMEKGLVKDVSIMSAQFGVASETSVKFLQTLGGVSGKSAIAKQNMLGLAKFAANAYGVGLDDVMNDVANASEEARMFAGKNADEMVRAAAQARQMGTTLDNMAKTAKGLLDFESSIQSELKASALIGKNINFNEARRLAFQGDIIGANKLILDQAKKIKFNQLNPIAQDAFAKAAGKTVKELQEMLNAEENLKEALKSKDPLVRAEAEKKKQMAEMMKNDPIAAKKAAQAEYEKGLIQEKNQTRMKQLQNEINAIFMEFIGPILEEIGPIFTQLLKYIKDNREEIKKFAQEVGKLYMMFKSLSIVSNILGGIGKMTSGFGKLITYSSQFLSSALKISSIFIGWSTSTSGIINTIVNISLKIEKIASGLKSASDTLKGFGTGFQSISNFIGKGSTQLTKLSNSVFNIGMNIEKVFTKFPAISKIGNIISNVFSGLGSSVKGIGSFVGGIFGKLGTGIGFFSKLAPIFGAVAKFLGPIGLVVSVIQGGIAFFKAFNETTGTVSQKAVAGLKAVVNALVVEPLKMVWDFLKKIPSFLADIDFAGIFKDVTNFLLDALTSLPDKIEELFSGGGGGIEWGKIFANIGRLAIEIIVFHFVKLPIAIAKTVGKLGLLILKAFGLNAIADGIASVADTLYTILKWPFELVYNWVMDKLGGKSPSEIGLAIVDGIKSVVDMLFDVLTYPFKKAAQIIPEIINILKTTFVDAFKSVMDVMFDLITYPFKKGFELIKSAVSEVGTFLKDTFSGAFTFIIGALEKVWEKMKGIGSFISDTIGKTFSFVGRIVGTSEETPSKTATESKTSVKTDDLLINTIVNSNRVLAEKLDKLTSMMASGQIAVYIDGQRANQLLATSNSKFGSFGQATTN